MTGTWLWRSPHAGGFVVFGEIYQEQGRDTFTCIRLEPCPVVVDHREQMERGIRVTQNRVDLIAEFFGQLALFLECRSTLPAEELLDHLVVQAQRHGPGRNRRLSALDELSTQPDLESIALCVTSYVVQGDSSSPQPQRRASTA